MLSCRSSAFHLSSGRLSPRSKRARISSVKCFQYRPCSLRRHQPQRRKVPPTSGLLLIASQCTPVRPKALLACKEALPPSDLIKLIWPVGAGNCLGESSEAAQLEQGGGETSFRTRSLSEDTVRIHPSPAPSAALQESNSASLMSQLMAGQRAQELGSAPVAGGLMANLSDPGVLVSLLQTGSPPNKTFSSLLGGYLTLSQCLGLPALSCMPKG